MDVENHEDIDDTNYVENPMRVEIMPVAEVVGIEVISEVLIEQKRNSEDSENSESINTNTLTLTFNQKLWFWFNFGGALFICLAFLTGFILLLVWFNDPEVFGPVNY
uniref:Uncharacterized protein n=1 Tax=viral metagenome TaxID=1070528 RepID=A0A6C0L872_9ZZZZ